ncbi:hypothetical protein [Variovorax sp. UMC13]|uniref:hypothetical protein n=1 Tax=Variovorax sp. UMC13 TaxID=1862326 RepID=UPI001600BE48|nr:hypothetical protein [Variovorax sp. UMC13]MBB1600404.1 hypothetical protein [Variovorax sp. UMC13]
MLIAYLETAAGQISIGLVDISKEELEGPLQPFDSLVSALAAVRGPLMLTSTHSFFGEAPADTPATLTFKYLGARSVEFPNEAAFYQSANEFLARGVYECPDTFTPADDGKFRARCEYFELIAEEDPSAAAPTLH